MNRLNALAESLESVSTSQVTGSVRAVRGGIILAALPRAAIGDLCEIDTRNGTTLGEIVGFESELCTIAPYDELSGIITGAEIRLRSDALEIPAPELGSAIDARGRILEGKSSKSLRLRIHSPAPKALSRTPITQLLETGVKTIDTFLTLGYGQRVGLFAPAGIGKSTLLGMIARNADVDVVVVGLVGERGREVREFISESLGADGMRRAIVVVSTSDENPMRRVLGAKLATSIAEHYRDQGKRVLLLVDSLTRMARAIRDLSLAGGEIPIRHGFTPSVYLELPRLLERAGTNQHGSITAIYTVLTPNEDEPDPLGEEVQSLLDGHIVLRSSVAQRGIRPAIDPLRSVSRLQNGLISSEHLATITKARRYLARLERDRDLVLFGGKPDAELEAALKAEPSIIAFMNQGTGMRVGLEESLVGLCSTFE